jgi:HSP20 family protein
LIFKCQPEFFKTLNLKKFLAVLKIWQIPCLSCRTAENGMSSDSSCEKMEVIMTNTIAKRRNGDVASSFGSVVDNIFQNNLRHFFNDDFFDLPRTANSGRVPVNIRETDRQYEMDVIAPGCKKENFQVSLDDNMLTVSYNQTQENKSGNEKEGWVRNEYSQRAFSRTFSLDDTVDINKIQATYSDGVLRLVLPKNENAQRVTKNIEVK